MAFKQVIEMYDFLENPKVDGKGVASLLKRRGADRVEVKRIKGERGTTDSIKVWIYGLRGRSAKGDAPTLGVIGRLGGIGARPEVLGLVSDGDGAITALSVALKLAEMKKRGDVLQGDVILSTHICPHAPVTPHDPVPFMGSPVNMETLNAHEVDPAMEAILSVDTTKGNRIINQRGFAISPTVKEGYILRVSEDLLSIMEITTGRRPSVFPITMQDITPYGNEIHHLNSILQPSVATHAPVVGVAITTETIVPGCATGASHGVDIEEAVRFCIEVAKAFGRGMCRFYDEKEFERMIALYGPMTHLQTLRGRTTSKGGNLDCKKNGHDHDRPISEDGPCAGDAGDAWP